MLKFQIMRR